MSKKSQKISKNLNKSQQISAPKVILKEPTSRARRYAITLNNWTEEEYNNIQLFFNLKNSTKWVIGKEVGEMGTPHLQMYVSFSNQILFSVVKEQMPRAHIEKANGNDKQNFLYCSKDGDYTHSEHFNQYIDFRKKLKEIVLKEEYNEITFKPFQCDIIDIIKNKPHDREIHFFVDENGNVGKSFLAKYLMIKYDDIILAEGKGNDIFNQVNDMINAGKYPKTIIVDVPRCHSKYFQASTIEKLKNGLLYSGKYEGGVCIFPRPNIIVLCNALPKDLYQTLSQDRIKIHNIE